MFKLDSARVSDQDGDKCRFYEKLNFFEEWLNKENVQWTHTHKSIIIAQHFNCCQVAEKD